MSELEFVQHGTGLVKVDRREERVGNLLIWDMRFIFRPMPRTQFCPDELRAIAARLDELNGVGKGKE